MGAPTPNCGTTRPGGPGIDASCGSTIPIGGTTTGAGGASGPFEPNPEGVATPGGA